MTTAGGAGCGVEKKGISPDAALESGLEEGQLWEYGAVLHVLSVLDGAEHVWLWRSILRPLKAYQNRFESRERDLLR